MNNTLSLNDLIINSAESAIRLQRSDGSFPPGHNGPWNQEDTPVRVTSHWGILLLKTYELTNDIKFKIAAESAYSYLTSKKARPYDNSFYCINSKDSFTQSNGLIGQVWSIESLLEAYYILENPSYLKLAEDLILKHNFDENLCLWNVLGIKGEILRIHNTLNQQLWFSVISHKVGNVCKNDEIQNKTTKFFKSFPSFIKCDGYIRMLIDESRLQKEPNPVRKFRGKIISLTRKKLFNKISKGYLSFTLVALSEFYNLGKNRDLFHNKYIKSVILNSVKYLDKVIFFDEKNKYGFQYNPIGFEVPFIKEKLSSYIEHLNGHTSEEWIIKQLLNHFDFKKMLMIKNTMDMNTLSSRIYELTRLKNRFLSL